MEASTDGYISINLLTSMSEASFSSPMQNTSSYCTK